MPPPQRAARAARAVAPPPLLALALLLAAAAAAPASAQLLFPFPFLQSSSSQQGRSAPSPLVPLAALFAAETEPLCIRDAPSSRWSIVAAARDRARPAVFCFTVDCRRYGQSGRCCQWFKNQAECQAALPGAREARLGGMQEQLACGKRLCREYGKSGFDTPSKTPQTWCERGWEQLVGGAAPLCSCVSRVGSGDSPVCTQEPF
ncbi:hypothetical protein Rsub_05289 [Raphidocelis subcapitata]|uniref:Uncharacterized protein n=1 Tax=Raphidocelis subcapitata TaxID=307507 RepID=A0A2V0P4U0_9CHLO|nr:hypothetical protein Rsub_05289 [Raphidocelis subcapitata]|eukprot:GBF92207.1 hypothetical protein Rsub_05289 [Raphidocelis subcapitata]